MLRRLGLRTVGIVVFGALTALTALTTAGPASAATPPWIHLCVDLFDDPTGSGVYCAIPLGQNLVVGVAETVQDGFAATGVTNWSFQFSNGSLGPFVVGETGMIKQANVNLCMQLDHADGDIVKGAACVNDAAEQWTDVYDSTDHRTWFESVWTAQHESIAKCLTWSNELPGDVYVDNCRSDPTDDWGSS